MDIEAMIKRVENAYSMLGNIAAKGDELDRLAMARQELRNLFADLNKCKEEKTEE